MLYNDKTMSIRQAGQILSVTNMKIPLFILLVLISGCRSATIHRGAQVIEIDGGVGVADPATPTLGIFTEDGLQVVLVVPASGADKAGVKAGDVLLELRAAEGLETTMQGPIPFTNSTAISHLLGEALGYTEEPPDIPNKLTPSPAAYHYF